MELEGIHTIQEASQMSHRQVWAHRQDFPHLKVGEFYIQDLLGFAGHDPYLKKTIGNFFGVELPKNGKGQSWWIFRQENGEERLVPSHAHFILKIDTSKQHIELNLEDLI